MVPTAVPPPVSRIPRARLLGTVGVIAVLTLLAVVVGALPWALPERVFSGWQVADVPGSLAALLAVGTVVCLVTATGVTFRTTGLRLGEPAGAAWLAIAGAAAGALVWNALVLAADADYVVGALIPVLHWAFSLVPALLAGAVTARRGSAAAGAAALGTGIVTLPLFALGFALFSSREAFLVTVGSSLWITAVLGVLPLLIGTALACGWGRKREWRNATGRRPPWKFPASWMFTAIAGRGNL